MLLLLLVACLAPKTMTPETLFGASQGPRTVSVSDAYGREIYAQHGGSAIDSDIDTDIDMAQFRGGYDPDIGTPRPARRWAWPVSGRITSIYGPRNGKAHVGLDIGAPQGERVRPVSGGSVVHAGPRGGYGELVEVDHGGGWLSRYGHLSEVLVAVGDEVSVNDVVGLVGSTGNSTGPHLHLEIRVNGETVDPLMVLP